MSGTTSLPTVMTTAGLAPQTPASLNSQLIANAQVLAPGLTANLPGSLVEDISSTATGAVILIDQARVDLVNSVTPFAANPFILNQLGQVYGVPLGIGSNTSVFVVFTGPPGFQIPAGFIVSDDLNPQYVIQDGGVIGAAVSPATTGSSQPLLAISNQPGSWAIPAGTVTSLITSVPTEYNVTVTNPLPGTPSTTGQTEESYRAQVLMSGLATAQGMPTYLKSRLMAIPGVQPRLVSVRQVGTQWEVICGGSGDPYLIAYAIFKSMDNIAALTGSTMGIVGITNATNGVVTTNLNHGYLTGQVVYIYGVVGMTGINSVVGGTLIPFTITVLTPTTFQLNYNTTASGTYTSGGYLLPNFRNITATVQDAPDAYVIPFVTPPMQTVSQLNLVWNTNSTNPVSSTAVATAGQVALAGYINSLVAGQPINILEMQTVFQQAIAGLIPPQQLIKMVFTVYVNGYQANPESATDLIILSDPESYFQVSSAVINITQG